MLALVLYTMTGLLNLLLGRERVASARLVKWDVQVGARRSIITSLFESDGKSYSWRSNQVIDGLLWDGIVAIRQAGKIAWKR